MSATGLRMYRSFELPWTQSSDQERRYRRIQLRVLATLLVLSLLIFLLPVPQLVQTLAPAPPAPIKIVLDQRPAPPALPPAPPAVVAELKAAPVVPSAAPVKPPKRLAQETPKPVTDTTSGSAPPGPTARERAQAAGLGALANDLASLRDSSVASKAITGRPDLTGKPNPNYTSDLNGGTDKGAGSERSLITAQAGLASGGINTAAFSRGTGGGGLAGRGTTQVEGYGGGGNGKGPGIGHGGNGSGNGTGNGGGGNGTGTGSGNGSGSGSGGSRSREEIERVFDQNKGAIYALYNRALRETPALQGKMVLRLTILPNGTVSGCDVVTSELHDAELEHHLVQRVLLFKFEARDVASVTTTKPIDFFPS